MILIQKIKLGLLNFGKILNREEIKSIAKSHNIIACNQDSDCPTLIRILGQMLLK